MIFKKTILVSALCTGLLAFMSFTAIAAPSQETTLTVVSKVQGDAPFEKGPQVLPPF